MSHAIPGCCTPEDGHPAEEWRSVVGWEGIYEISSHGRVRSVRGKTRKGKILATNLTKRTNHVRLTLSRDGGRIRQARTVHQLVAEAFIGPRPEGLQVRHWDDNKHNNHVSNLSYGTQSDNTLDMVRNGKHNMARVTECIKGHPYDDENTKYDTRGKRYCRICSNEKAYRWRERNPEKYRLYVNAYQREYQRKKRAERRAAEQPPAA